MTIATSRSAALPRPATFAKMEDRKRPASSAVDDCAPPSKRQAVNGASKSKDDSGDMKEEAWIEVSVSHDIPCVVIIPLACPGHVSAAVASMPRCHLLGRQTGNPNAIVLQGLLASAVANARLAGNSTPGSSQASPCFEITSYCLPSLRCLYATMYLETLDTGMKRRVADVGARRNTRKAPYTGKCSSTSGKRST